MKFQFLTLVVAFAAVAQAADKTTSSEVIKPTAVIPVPPGVVCAMSVCPSVTAPLSKRDIACPVACPNDCSVIDDVCCPGNKKAVCKAGSVLPSGSASASAPVSSASVSIVSSYSVSMLPSQSASASASPSVAKPSAANANTVSVLSTLLVAAVLAVGLNQL